MKTYEWKTAKGAEVKIEVSQEHKEIINCDGDKVEVTKKEMRLEKLTVNGTEFDGNIHYHKGEHVVSFKLNGQPAGAIIPKEIYNEIMKPTREREEAARKSAEEYQKHHDAVTKMMSY